VVAAFGEGIPFKGTAAGLRCIQQWTRAAGIKLEEAASVPGLLKVLVATLSASDSDLVDAGTEAVTELLATVPEGMPAASAAMPALAELTRALSAQLPRLNGLECEIQRALTRLGAGLAAAPWGGERLSTTAGLLALLVAVVASPDRSRCA
jgi:hypothetical protein